MYFTNLNITDSFTLTGRGKVLITNLEFVAHEKFFKIEDTLLFEDKIYIIRGVEALLVDKDGEKKEYVSFVVNDETLTVEENWEKQFKYLLWQLPSHWFSEVNNGVRVMQPISVALHETFFRKYGERLEDAFLLPIFYREKKKYEDFLRTKQIISKNKPVFGMIHLSPDETNGERIERAIKEMQIMEEEGVDGIIVENYHGSVEDIKQFFSSIDLNKTKLLVGINVLPNQFEEAFELADKVGAKFIQLDYVAGTYYNSKFIYEPLYMAIREKYSHIAVMGGVWPKYYLPLKDSVLKDDIIIGMKRADAIVVTGEGTGKNTPLEKIEEFKKITKDFPLIIGAGLTPETVKEQLSIASGAIVGSTFKPAGITTKEMSRSLVKKFMDEVKKIRK